MKTLALPLLLLVLAGRPSTQPQTSDSPPIQELRRWVDEDVRWIICREEKAVFNRLTDDSERKEFIYQFWFRRDPQPATPVSEAKVEHYRRMDFADGHFRENEIRGSLTERGRIWIMYGPPQRREVNPHSRERTFSSEVWHYDRISDVGENLDLEFVDRDNSGKYRLDMAPEKRDLIFTFWPCGKTIDEWFPSGGSDRVGPVSGGESTGR